MPPTERWSSAEHVAAELGVELPPISEFRELADLTALRRSDDGSYYESNYVRGPLLFALVVARRPSTILEFGTGRGYGSLSIARALVEHDIAGRIYTIDVLPDDVPIDWPYRDREGARTERWARRAFWERHIPPDWTARVSSLTGRSNTVTRTWMRLRLPPIELAFIDGGHDRATARGDMVTALSLSRGPLGLLLDDVADRPGFGVAAAMRQMFNEDMVVTMIPTDWGPGARWPGAGMAWLAIDRPTEVLPSDGRPNVWERVRGLLR